MSVRFRLVNQLDRRSETCCRSCASRTECDRPVADETGAEDYVGLALQDRAEQNRVFGRVVFPVGILYENHIASSVVEPCAERRALTAILLVKDDSYAGQPSELLQDRACPIGREIVNDDDFDIQRQMN